MSTKQYTDWRSWIDGLIDASVPAGATAVVTILTTNGLDNLGLHGVGESWKTALAQVAIQMGVGAANYIQKKPRPAVVTETVDTTFTAKTPDGGTVKQSSTTTTTTPISQPTDPAALPK